jgi:hypothetical protein
MKLTTRRISIAGRLNNGRIHWSGNETRACLYLAACGFSYAYITNRTNLSRGQIANRLKIKNVKISGYRNGEGRMASKLINGCIFLKRIGGDS